MMMRLAPFACWVAIALFAASLSGCAPISTTTITTTTTAPPSPTPSPTPALEGSNCTAKFPAVQAMLKRRYSGAAVASTPSYVANGLMLHNFECFNKNDALDCYGVNYNLDNASLEWDPVCPASEPTRPQDSIFCPSSQDWKPGKQSVSFSYLRDDLLASTIYTAGDDWLDVGYILGDNAYTKVPGLTPRCAYGGDANTLARNGGGCGAFGGQANPTAQDPASIYSESCQVKVFAGKDRTQWPQAYQNAHGSCSIVLNNDAGAGSSDPTVVGYRTTLDGETKDPFDDMFVASTKCTGDCPHAPFGCNEILIPCCQSIEVSQPSSNVKNQNFPALVDLDVLVIFYVIRNHDAHLDKKMHAAKRIAELLAKATNNEPVMVVGIDQEALVQHRIDSVFSCQDAAQPSLSSTDDTFKIHV